MPVFNEEVTIRGVIKDVLNQRMVDKLIIVYEPSTDNTLKYIQSMLPDKRITLIKNKKQMGKGYSVRRGINIIEDKKENVIIIQDADKEYSPKDYTSLMSHFSYNSPVIGERTVIIGHRYRLGSYANSMHTFLFNLLFRQNVRDVNACYKVFNKEMISGHIFKQNGWNFDMELAITFAKKGYKIKNAPIQYKGRTFEEGKKIGAGAAIEFVFYLLKERFNKNV